MDSREHHERILEKTRRVDDTEHASLNIHQKKMLRDTQAHGHHKINHYSEGLCYGCGDVDYVNPTIIEACKDCIRKKGEWRDSALLTFVVDKPEVYCMICRRYKIGGAQINIRVCQRCNYKLSKSEQQYRNQGGKYGNPFYKWLRKRQGRDWRILEATQPKNYRK